MQRLTIAAVIALVFSRLSFSEPALALTSGILPSNTLEATSIVQFSGISPVAIPPPAPSSFSQTMGANPPDFANSLFQRSVLDICSTCQPLGAGTANMSMGAVTFGAVVEAAVDNVAIATTALGSFVDDLIVNPPAFLPQLAGSSGTLLLPLRVTGSVSVVLSTPPAGAPPWGPAEAGFSVFCATTLVSGPGGAVCGGSNPFHFSVTGGNTPQFVFDHSQVVDMTLQLTVPFTFGQEFILDREVWFNAGVIAGLICDGCHYQGTVDGHFGDTGVWGAVTVKDATGHVVPGATIISASGIDYLNPTTGPPGSAAPEPGTLAMFLVGCLSLALVRGRRAVAPIIRVTTAAALVPIASLSMIRAADAGPTSVTIAGSLQSEVGCAGDWDPGCAITHLAYDFSDDVWQGTWTIPAGSFEYKAALNDSFTVNYGLHAQQDGLDIPLSLPAMASVKFYYDDKTHWVTDNHGSVIVTAPGDFQSELGCPGDWDPSCLRSWLEDPDGNGIYTFVTSALPMGNYEAKAAINESFDENYGLLGIPDGANIPFVVPANNTAMLFSYSSFTNILTIRPLQPGDVPAPAPAPATLVLLGVGVAGLAASRRFRPS